MPFLIFGHVKLGCFIFTDSKVQEGSMTYLPTIKIIATGGTIAGKASSSTATTEYQAGALDIEVILASLPDVHNIAKLEHDQLFKIDSVNMTTDRLLTLSKHVNKVLKDDHVDGVVITHGTDTLEETAYFLHLTIKSRKPVVVVGAIRPATTISADGPLNLYNGIIVACNRKTFGKGVLVVFGERIDSARFIRKINSSSVAPFKAIEQGCIGTIVGGAVYFYYKELQYLHTSETIFDIHLLQDLPHVSIIYTHQGDQRYLYDAAVQAGAKGIVVATAGGNTVSEQAMDGMDNAVKQGVIIVRSTRLSSGIVSRTKMDDQHEYIAAEALNPQKSRILLMLALTKTNVIKEIQQFFHMY